MKQRRIARECAVQFLFQHELNPPANLDDALDRFWEDRRATLNEGERPAAADPAPAEGVEPGPPAPSADEAAIRVFADALVRGVVGHRDAIDGEITRVSQNWALNRLAAVDRNIIRLAIFEMQHRPDIPPVVSINEAVDIARKFSTAESGRFVNGLLDRIKNELSRPARTPAPTAA